MIPLLHNNSFPPVTQALRSPNGLLAAGGDLSTVRLLEAYRHGIFPWFSEGEPILWWSPDPRMVLFPQEFKVSHSLHKTLRNGRHEVRCDSAPSTGLRTGHFDKLRTGHFDKLRTGHFDTLRTGFEQVMRACAAPREGASGTWIHEEMIGAYCELHRLGYAHSVETWIDGELVGGLYGMALGRMFYGESMFSIRPNASKIALAHLAAQLKRWNFGMIDCQMNTPHLASLGAREIPRKEFIASLQDLINCSSVPVWQFDKDLFT
jgi:leucyl/phenylalanyl-tRNA--protein transferase